MTVLSRAPHAGEELAHMSHRELAHESHRELASESHRGAVKKTPITPH